MMGLQQNSVKNTDLYKLLQIAFETNIKTSSSIVPGCGKIKYKENDQTLDKEKLEEAPNTSLKRQSSYIPSSKTFHIKSNKETF